MTPPRSILFACTLNRTRSPMAEALAARALGPDTLVMSCGVEPCEEFDPFIFPVLAEAGAALDDRPGRGFEILDDRGFDAVVTLTEAARAEALRRLGPGAVVEFWPAPDPTEADGSRDQRLEAYRELLRELERRIAARFWREST